MFAPTLLLNADARPVSFLPLSTITWQDAIRLVYLNAATTLHNYQNWEVHSPSVTMQVPSVLLLNQHVRQVHRWIARDDHGPPRTLVFLRDRFICQYCNRQFPRTQLTIDHVLPKKLGGRTRWTNVTTSCSVCNSQRGCDTRIQPLTQPFRPSHNLLIKHMQMFPLTIPDRAWSWYLNWQEDKLQVVDPRSKIAAECFDSGLRVSLQLT
jgi:5-methylcytosine-specific restriction endonuclease McrA